MSSVPQPRWKIEIRAATVPREEWMEMRMATRGIGKRCRFVEREEAEDALKALLKVQPHAILRIVPT